MPATWILPATSPTPLQSFRSVLVAILSLYNCTGQDPILALKSSGLTPNTLQILEASSSSCVLVHQWSDTLSSLHCCVHAWGKTAQPWQGTPTARASVAAVGPDQAVSSVTGLYHWTHLHLITFTEIFKNSKIVMEPQRPWRVETILRRMIKAEVIILSDCKLYSKVTVIKTV